MSRYVRNTAVLFKLETTYGTDAVPGNTTDALLVSEFTCDDSYKYENAPEIRPYMGGGRDYVTEKHVVGTLKVKLGGSGAAGTSAQWGDLFRAAGFAETISAGVRVDRTPISAAFESGTLYYYDDGVLKKALGVRMNLTGLKLGYGGIPEAAFSFVGLKGGDTAVASPALTLTAWKPPLAVNSINSGMVTIGCTYATGALSGGTTFVSKGLDLALGGKVDFAGLLGGESVEFTDRNVTGKLTLDLTAAQEISNLGIADASTTQGIGLLHGTVAGYKLLTFMPNVQLKNPKKDNINGKRVISYDLLSVPTPGTGNDELRIVEL
jgi:hypothetical protein